MKSPVCSMLAKASWVITALASINIGLALFGINVFELPLFADSLAMLVKPLLAIIGLSGVWSLAHFFMNPTSCQ